LENLSDSHDINSGGRTLKRISEPQLKKVWFCTNWISINHSLIKNV